MTVQCHWRYSRSHSYRCTPFSCADDQDHLIDPAHRRGAGHVAGHSRHDHQGLVSCADRVRRAATAVDDAKGSSSRSSPGDDLDQSGTCTRGPAGERDAWRLRRAAAWLCLWSNSSSRSTPQQSQAVEDQELSIGAAVGVVMLPPLSRVAWDRRPGLSSARAAVARYCVGLDGHHRARNASLPRRDEILGRPREIAWPRAVGDSRCWS